MSDQSSDISLIDRRRLLQKTAAIGAIGLAGCGGDGATTDTPDQGDTPTVTMSDGVERYDVAWRGAQGVNPADIQYNPWNIQTLGDYRLRTACDPLAKYDIQSGEYTGYLAEDWEYDPDALTASVTLKSDRKWHDGTDVTATDVATRIRIDKYFGGSIWSYIDDLSVDGNTLQYNLTERVNPGVLLDEILDINVEVQDSVFGEYLESLQEAEGDEDALNDAKTELTEFSFEDPVGNSMWEFGETTNEYTEFHLFTDHPQAENINYSRARILYMAQDQNWWAAYQTGRTDACWIDVPPNVAEEFPDDSRYYKTADVLMTSLGFQHDDEIYGRRNVRRAIAYALDVPTITENAAPGAHYSEIPCGLGAWVLGKPFEWLGDASEDFLRYEQDLDKATQLLEEDGFTKEGGSWLRPDGNPMEAPIRSQSGTQIYEDMSRTIAGQLSEFGIDSHSTSIEASAFYTGIASGDFRLTMNIPLFVERIPFVMFRNFYGTDDPIMSGYNMPETVEDIPAPFDENNDTTTIEAASLIEELGRAVDEEEQTELTQQIAWAFNMDIPDYPMLTLKSGMHLRGNRWTQPDDEYQKYSTIHYVKDGIIKYKPES